MHTTPACLVAGLALSCIGWPAIVDAQPTIYVNATKCASWSPIDILTVNAVENLVEITTGSCIYGQAAVGYEVGNITCAATNLNPDNVTAYTCQCLTQADANGGDVALQKIQKKARLKKSLRWAGICLLVVSLLLWAACVCEITYFDDSGVITTIITSLLCIIFLKCGYTNRDLFNPDLTPYFVGCGSQVESIGAYSANISWSPSVEVGDADDGYPVYCSKGQYKDGSECKPCQAFTFQNSSSHRSATCETQPTCGMGQEFVDSKTAERTCPDCPANTFQSSTPHQTTCITQSRCGKGQMMNADSKTTQRTCSDCPANTFQSSSSHRTTTCDTQPSCGTGQKFIDSRTAERTCPDCPANTFQSSSSHRTTTCDTQPPCGTGQKFIDSRTAERTCFDCPPHANQNLTLPHRSTTCVCKHPWSGTNCELCNGLNPNLTPDPTPDCNGITSTDCQAFPDLPPLCPIACTACVASTTTTTTTAATTSTTTRACNGAGDPKVCGREGPYLLSSCNSDNFAGNKIRQHCPVMCNSCTWTTTTTTTTATSTSTTSTKTTTITATTITATTITATTSTDSTTISTTTTTIFCSLGQYYSATASQSCLPCPPNFYQENSNHQLTECTEQTICGQGQRISMDSNTAARFCLGCPSWTYQSSGLHRKFECEAGVSTCNDAGTFNQRSGICDCYEVDKGPACDGVLAVDNDDVPESLKETTIESLISESIGAIVAGVVSGVVTIVGVLVACCWKQCCGEKKQKKGGEEATPRELTVKNPGYEGALDIAKEDSTA